MAQSIGLSFRGDGRVLALTPKTVRKAFFEFIELNRLKYHGLQVFDAPGLTSPAKSSAVMDRLFRRLKDGDDARLTEPETRAVERELNRLLLLHELALSPLEGRIERTRTVAPGAGIHWRSVSYTIRYGVIFELERLNLAALLQGSERDICVEKPDRSLHILRFLNTGTDHLGGRLLLRFADRFDLKRIETIPRLEFDYRRLFSIRRVAAINGFHFDGLLPIARG